MANAFRRRSVDPLGGALVDSMNDSWIQFPIGGFVDLCLHSPIDALSDSSIGPSIDSLTDPWADSVIHLLIG